MDLIEMQLEYGKLGQEVDKELDNMLKDKTEVACEGRLASLLHKLKKCISEGVLCETYDVKEDTDG